MHHGTNTLTWVAKGASLIIEIHLRGYRQLPTLGLMGWELFEDSN